MLKIILNVCNISLWMLSFSYSCSFRMLPYPVFILQTAWTKVMKSSTM